MRRIVVLLGWMVACVAHPAVADVVCQDSSYVEVVFNRTYPPNSQFAGQPYDYVTISPNGRGETFRNANGVHENDGRLDIEVRVYVRNCQGTPIAGIPASQISLFSPALCICPGGADADELLGRTDGPGTDVNGVATFTGTIRGGGCANSVDVYVDGMHIGVLMDETGRTVKFNSGDPAHVLVSPCFIAAGDLSYFAGLFGHSALDPWAACSDFNERGDTIDASDLAAIAFVLGASCR